MVLNISAVVVTVADCQTQKGLVDYRIPVSYLTPFHQYHLELSKVSQVGVTATMPRGKSFEYTLYDKQACNKC